MSKKTKIQFTINKTNFDTGGGTDSWDCVDCGVNTAPGLKNGIEMKQAFAADWNISIMQTVDTSSEVYMVTPQIWKAAGMKDWNGCLCIGCLEKRLGRPLTPMDFNRDHCFASMPGTKRLLARRDRKAA
jgi:hypothetical protein